MTISQKINYGLLCGLLYPLSLLPLRVLYVIADITAWLAGSVIGYRRKVIRENLKTAFPEKTEKERREIEKKFYHFLADYGVETLKMLTISPQEMQRRMVFENVGELKEILSSGRDIVVYLGHYCNWEWVSSLPMWLGDMAGNAAQVYHPLHNKAMDRLFIRLRTHFDAHNIGMKEIIRFLIDRKRSGKVTICGFIADQEPRMNHHLFADFFHRETGWYTGPERIARFQNAAVYFCHMERPRRGYYRAQFRLMTLTPGKEPMFGITRDFITRLEQNIAETPGYYLWSHKRWKHSRADFEAYWGDKAEEKLSHL